MRINLSQTVLISFLALTLSGCSIANNKTLVTSNSNLGLDFDSPPPRIALALSSTRKIITPTFEDGQTLPALSGMSTQGNILDRFFHGLSSTIATGDAAYIMSYLYTDCNKDVKPVPKNPEVRLTRRPQIDADAGLVRPTVMVSTSLVGAMVSWSSRIPLLITSAKVGFARHEEIATPVSVTLVYLGEYIDHYIVSAPSFLATIDQGVDREEKGQDLKYLQFFAIGKSASDLVLRSDVRKNLFKRIFPDMEDTFCEQDHETRAW